MSEQTKYYKVITDSDWSPTLLNLEQSERVFDRWKDDYISDLVVAGESFVAIIVSEDKDFDDYTEVKKVIAVIDNNRTELRTPREEGYDWDYWAKWQEVDVKESESSDQP